MRLYVKYMVSMRCKMVVRSELEKLGLHYTVIDLGEADIKETLNPEQYDQLAAALKRSGLELTDDKKSTMVKKIKNVIREQMHSSEDVRKINFPEYLSKKLGCDYTYLSRIFTEVEGTTIQHFIIKDKIERVKEMIVYDELPLTEIAYRLQYSSVAHLSNQFRKVTHHSPTSFKQRSYKRLSEIANA